MAEIEASLAIRGSHGTVKCFGAFAVRLDNPAYGRGERTITRFRTQKTASLLAYLAYHADRTHTREFLIDAFWPDTPLEKGRQSLSTALTSLRAQLEPPPVPEGTFFITDRLNIGIRSGTLVTDVAAFATLVKRAEQAARQNDRVLFTRWYEAASALYAVPLLDGMADDWILAAQADVEALLDKLERLSSRLSATGRTAQTHPVLLPQDFIEEAVTPPASAITESKTDSTPSARVGSGTGGVTSPGANRILPSQSTHFFGRDQEMASLVALLTDPSTQPTRLITLTGPGGVGKTRLSLAVAEQLVAPSRTAALTPVAMPPSIPTPSSSRAASDRTPFPLQNIVYAREQTGLSSKTRSVFYIALADISESDAEELLPIALFEAIAASDERMPRGRTNIIQWLIATLSGFTHPVLFLDNAEQIIPSVAELVEALLPQIPDLTFVITSRQRLGIYGERLFPVKPLSLPASTHESDAAPAGDPTDVFESIRNSPSVALFVDRAQLHRPDFRLTGQNLRSVVRLVNYLEGIPLAIELAAGWAQVLTPERMMSVKGGRFSLLKKGGSNSERQKARQGSVLNTLEWSYRLLTPDLQKAFAALSVFRGSFPAEAAEATLGLNVSDAFEVFDILMQLTDTSLLQSYETAQGHEEQSNIRFRLLETVREFAATRLSRADAVSVHRAHALYFLAFLENLEAQASSQPVNGQWRERIEHEENNLHAALDWTEVQALRADAKGASYEPSEAPLTAALLNVRLTMSLYRYWLTHGRIAEGKRRFETALGFLDVLRGSDEMTVSLEATLLNRTGVFAMTQGNVTKATHFFEKSLALCRQESDVRCIGAALNNLAILASKRSDFEAARQFYEESLDGFRAINDEQNVGVVLANLGGIANDAGDLSRARTLFTESVTMARRIGGTSALATRLRNLSEVFYKQESLVASYAGYRESLTLTKSARDAVGAAFSLLGLGFVGIARGANPKTETVTQSLRAAFFYLHSARVPLTGFIKTEMERYGLNNLLDGNDGSNEDAEARLWRAVKAYLSDDQPVIR